jgi:hypothetical protein
MVINAIVSTVAHFNNLNSEKNIMNLRIDSYEKEILTNALNVRECELLNDRHSEEKKENGDCYSIDLEIDYIQILLAKVEATNK